MRTDPTLWTIIIYPLAFWLLEWSRYHLHSGMTKNFKTLSSDFNVAWRNRKNGRVEGAKLREFDPPKSLIFWRIDILLNNGKWESLTRTSDRYHMHFPVQHPGHSPERPRTSSSPYKYRLSRWRISHKPEVKSNYCWLPENQSTPNSADSFSRTFPISIAAKERSVNLSFSPRERARRALWLNDCFRAFISAIVRLINYVNITPFMNTSSHERGLVRRNLELPRLSVLPYCLLLQPPHRWPMLPRASWTGPERKKYRIGNRFVIVQFR